MNLKNPPPFQCGTCARLEACGLAAAHCVNQMAAWARDREIPICAIYKEREEGSDMDSIQYTSVDSSFIDAVGHDGESTMMVRYKSGKEYAFHGISAGEFTDIKNSPSVGKAINSCGVKGVEV